MSKLGSSVGKVKDWVQDILFCYKNFKFKLKILELKFYPVKKFQTNIKIRARAELMVAELDNGLVAMQEETEVVNQVDVINLWYIMHWISSSLQPNKQEQI